MKMNIRLRSGAGGGNVFFPLSVGKARARRNLREAA